MLRSSFAAVVMLCSRLSTVQSADAFMNVVDIHQEQWATQLQAAFAEFDCLDMLTDMQLKDLEGKTNYQVRNADCFEGRTGMVYSLTASGSVVWARFCKVSGADVFDVFIQSLMDGHSTILLALACLGGEEKIRVRALLRFSSARVSPKGMPRARLFELL